MREGDAERERERGVGAMEKSENQIQQINKLALSNPTECVCQ